MGEAIWYNTLQYKWGLKSVEVGKTCPRQIVHFYSSFGGGRKNSMKGLRNLYMNPSVVVLNKMKLIHFQTVASAASSRNPNTMLLARTNRIVKSENTSMLLSPFDMNGL